MNILIINILLINIFGVGNLLQIPIEDRIVGGKNVSITEYPYHLSLLFNGSHHCGAALIAKGVAITAAHCLLQHYKMYAIRAGTSTLNHGGVVVGVRRVILHPKFRSYNEDYDVAVVILNRYLRYRPSVATISLPEANKDPSVGTLAVVTGWGLTSPDGTMLSTSLRGVAVPVISQNNCKELFGAEAITERMMCAGYLFGGKDSCQGDSGGPLAANGQLIGVVSWGIGCAEPFHPGVYVRISRVRDFIKQYTGL